MKLEKSKPRNPVANAARMRSGAGSHQKSNKALRQMARQQLRRSLKDEGGFGQSMHRVH